MRTPPVRRLLLVAIIAAILAAGAGGAVVARSGGSSKPADLRVVHTSAGPMVVTGTGLTVYIYLPDPTRPPATTCTGDCANDWPPILAPSGPIRLQGIRSSAIAAVTTPDGARQLTLDGYPLYRFAGDHRPGDTYGESIGNTWFAVAPDGSFVTLPPVSFQPSAPPAGSSLRVVTTAAGPVLADAAGQTLYTYKDDTPTRIACVAAWCTQDWPPLIVQHMPATQPTVTANISTTRRSDGTLQVTVSGHPVYRFAGDTTPGDVRGLGIGDDWYPLTPAGGKITTEHPG